jgi:hypothetical protein
MVKLPDFHRTPREDEWVNWQLQTARYVRTLWAAASPNQRRDPEFLLMLARCAWVNNPDGSDEARISWRNAKLVRWAGLPESADDNELVSRLARRLKLAPARAKWLVSNDSGITRYYPAFRPAFDRQIRKHAAAVAAAFRAVAASAPDPAAKVGKVARMVLALPEIRVPAGGRSALLNGLSPVLACVDPQRRFPIMNARTARLLGALGKRTNEEGALALSRLIGRHGLRHAFDLDVYAQTRFKQFPTARTTPEVKLKDPKAIGIKAEETTVVVLTKDKPNVRRLHNKLINRFRRALEWDYVLAESAFDAIVEDWKKGRRLLVEAKPSTSGPAGRMQLRLAIGQLYDYRFQHFRKTLVRTDLAELTKSRPDAASLSLLNHLGIKALWFESNKLRGTIELL